ncbi:DUF1707 domain-containing protein [Saccharopolyspora erythraea]|uniref:DUF1707 SHOCT-like domain-containing protein n=1 Tax=Saccharopolyspora erythraea TaxID=1836 RepID=UPI001BA83749|nr:DUF1707 domain-containing protein [Saccharopolyspora erythraea]QUH05523.1 DUF1707 domain-containing protein [Saccharopolyspora erythraea]
MSEPDSVRASDADREAVAERLRAAMGEGRLDLAEYDERVRAAYSARTLADLVPLTADLPAPAPSKQPAEVARKERERKKLVKEWRDWAGISFMLTGIWLVTWLPSGQPYFFWPIFPMGIWAVVLVAGMLFGGKDGGDDATA